MIKFSRLLKISSNSEYSEKNNLFVVELIDENNEKTLYLSYFKKNYNRKFKKFSDCDVEEKCFFNDLSDTCLLSSCEDASHMFWGAPIEYFDGDCSSLKEAVNMFFNSDLKIFNSKIPNLENANFMFAMSKLEMFKSDNNKIKYAKNMFKYSNLKEFDADFVDLRFGEGMFLETKIEKLKITKSLIENKNKIFNDPEQGSKNSISKNYSIIMKKYPFLFL